MKTWTTKFSRENYGVNPPLKQTACVLFTTDVPYENEHLDEFEAVAWSAMWAQCPHWKDPSPPAPGMSGWSSVFGSGRYEEAKTK